MSRKRRNTSSPELDESPPAKRRPSPSLYREDVIDTKEQPRLHEETGQANAFPGLGDEDEPFYGPALDGIDYLKMVRSEAKDVPKLLSAAIERAVAEGEEEARGGGLYFDGVYTAPAVHLNGDIRLPMAQTRYYDTLLAQFKLVQATLRCTPTLEAVQALRDVRPVSFPPKSGTASKAWQRHVLRYDPHPAQLACMDIESVFELVHLLGKLVRRFSSYSESMKRRLGAWIWASIGRFPDRGELGSDEFARMRELATVAAALLRGAEDDLTEDSHLDNGDEGEGEEGDDGMGKIELLLEAATQDKAAEEPSTAEKDEEDSRTMDSGTALFDMILTVIGEVYGQRDLLELRPRWTGITTGSTP